MLLYHLNSLFSCLIVVSIVVILCATCAYHVNSKRTPDDPKKKIYHPLAILLAPITFPLFAILSLCFFLLRVLAYTVFLILFVLALIFLRNPFLLDALRKAATVIGDRLLEANTMLVRLFLSPWRELQRSA